jgi:membrane-associated protease RseP (regulator of RpoE activity)
MRADELRLLALQLGIALEEVMKIEETVVSPHAIVFRGTFTLPAARAFGVMREKLVRLGCIPMLSGSAGRYEVRVVPEAQPGRANPLVNLLLFLLTVGSTLLVGAEMAGVNVIAEPRRFAAGIPFAGSIIAILAVHEFGHYLMSMFHGVKATLPYFIPAPTLIGTLGAVIKTKSHIPDRKSLLDIGAAGPICGFVVSLVALGVGMGYSEVVDIGPLLRRGGVQEFGDSIAVALMALLVKGKLAPGQDILFTPVAFAGWVGLLVTAFNLMPVGQLDGGHIMYALVGRWHSVVAKITVGALLVMGLYWPPWWGWVFLIMLLGMGHAPPLDDVTPLDMGRRLVAGAALVIFVICFVPVPIPIKGVL